MTSLVTGTLPANALPLNAGERWAEPFRSAPGRKRPCPADFRDRYILGGWEEVELEYGSRPSVICRWIEESGGDELRRARSQYLRDKRAEAASVKHKRRCVA